MNITPILLSLCLIFIVGCGSNVETNPSKILPVLKQAQKCCDGQRCSGAYEYVPEYVACTDVSQLEACLQGNEEQCPVKGNGAF